MQENSKMKRLIGTIIMIVFSVLIIFAFSTNLLFYKNSAAPEFVGKYYIYINDKENMNNIPKNTAVICEQVAKEEIAVNNVILATINPENDKAILRVVDMDEDTYVLKSDFPDTTLEEPVEDTLVINKENAIALCKWTSLGFGKYVAFATSNAGIVTMIVLPCTIIVLILASCILDKDKISTVKASGNSDSEKERRAREKQEKAEAKRQALINKKNIKMERQLNDDNLIESIPDEIYEEDTASENDDIISETISEMIKPEVKKEVIKTINDDEYPAVQKKVEEKIAAAERRMNSHTETNNYSDSDKEKTINVDIIEKTEKAKSPVIPKEQPTAEKTAKPKVIKAAETVEKKKPAVKKDISEKPASKPRPKTAPSKKPTASGNKYSANKYTSSAMKRTSSKSSIDDLLKTIDSEKSKSNKK